MVGAALADENCILIGNCIESAHSLDGVLQAALVACHEDRKGCEWNAWRHNGADGSKGLAVGHYKAWRHCQACERHGQLAFLHYNGNALIIQNIAQHLLLWQDEPALGSSTIYGGDKDNDVVGRNQIAQKLTLHLLGTQCGDGFL